MALLPSEAIRRLRQTWGPTDWITVEVPREEVPFAVPIEAWSGTVGPAFMRELAERLHGAYIRDPEGIGLMEDFGILAGPSLDPERVHPLIHEFYERTSRFTLSVKPKWHPLYLPAFWPLALIACQYALEAGLDHVLVGMRRPRYVELMRPLFGSHNTETRRVGGKHAPQDRRPVGSLPLHP
jgi:hypothetical protein